MSARGWYVLDGRRVVLGPLTTERDAVAAVPLAKTRLHEHLRDLARDTVLPHEEIQARLRGVRVMFGVRASRGGFKRLPQPRRTG